MTPNIDALNELLARVSMLHSFVLEVDGTTGLYDLVVLLAANENADDAITFRFKNIAELKIDFDAGGWVQFMMLRVTVNNCGYERKYRVHEKEHGAVGFTCTRIETESLLQRERLNPRANQ